MSSQSLIPCVPCILTPRAHVGTRSALYCRRLLLSFCEVIYIFTNMFDFVHRVYTMDAITVIPLNTSDEVFFTFAFPGASVRAH